LALYGDFFLTSATNVLGEGIGSANRATKLADDADLDEYRNIDSGVLEVMFVLGWPGSLLYVGGLLWLLSEAFGGPARQDLAVKAAGAVVLATLAMTVSYNTLINVGGVVFWTFLGLMLAAQTFYRRSRPTPVLASGQAGFSGDPSPAPRGEPRS
jgi:hypothetical protein